MINPDFTKFKHSYMKPQYLQLEEKNQLVVNLPFACESLHHQFRIDLLNYLNANYPDLELNISFKTQIIAHKIKPGLSRCAGIKNIIAVTAGKGGVGKSTVALNLAISLAKNGARVGILDADIYGPSLPTLVGEKAFKPPVEDSSFVPLDKYGIKIMSFGFLIDQAQPAIWRGAMINKALEQMLNDTKWGELDYLVLDMPPGTGDIHLTMCQKFPITATIVVTTPQDIALVDVVKSIEMYKKMDISCVGVVENMATHICTNCGHSEDIFGRGGADAVIAHYGFELLAKLPLNIDICKSCDEGLPLANSSTHKLSEIFNTLGINVSFALSHLGRDFSSKLGKIKVL